MPPPPPGFASGLFIGYVPHCSHCAIGAHSTLRLIHMIACALTTKIQYSINWHYYYWTIISSTPTTVVVPIKSPDIVIMCSMASSKY